MKRLPLYILLSTFCILFLPLSASAAIKSFDITATSSSFSPATVNVDSGDVVTLNFSVPTIDDYCCGLEVRSSKFSTVAVAKGSSNSVSFTADTSFTFSSYWPASSVHKADGTVTVQATTVAPAPDPTPAPKTPAPDDTDGDE